MQPRHRTIAAMVSRVVKRMWCCGAAALDAPGGRVRVRVGRPGDGLREFYVEASRLNHPLFQDLLRSSGEELGFSYDGPLRIACEVDVFRSLLRLLGASRRGASVHSADLLDLAPKLSSDDGRSK